MSSNLHEMKGMSGRSVRRYEFGDYLLEPTEGRLSRISLEPVDLTGKPLEVLAHLVENHGRLVPRDELKDKFWPGMHLGADECLTEAISRIRITLGSEQYIQTVRGRGYRFVVPVSEVIPDLVGDEQVALETAKAGRSRLGLKMILTLLVAATSVGIGSLWIRARLTAASPLQRAGQLELKGDDDLAFETLAQVQQNDRDFVEARLRGAWLKYQADRNDEARQFFAPLLGTKLLDGASKATMSKAVGMNKLLDDQDDGALNDFQAAVGAEPRDLETWIWIANIATNSGNPKMAAIALDKCDEIDRWNPLCGYERIDALSREGNFEKAISEFNEWRKHSPYPWLDEPAGYAELAGGHFSDALGHFKTLEEQAPTRSSTHIGAGQDGIVQVDLVQGKLTDARETIKDARNSTGSHYEKVDYSILLATIDAIHGSEGLQGKPQPVQEELDAIKPPYSSETEIRIARVYAMAGNHDAALYRLDQLQKQGADHGANYAAARDFVKAMQSLSEHDLGAAASYFSRSKDHYENPETAYFQGKAAMEANEWDAAISSFEWITKNKTQVFKDSIGSLIPLAEFNLSICYKQRGDNSEAKKHLTEAKAWWTGVDSAVTKQGVGSSN